MTNSEFMNILNDDSLELTVEELENIIEEELQKDESEMDPDLIEYCLYYISKAEADGGKEKKADIAGNDKIAEPPAADKLKKSRFNGKLKNESGIPGTEIAAELRKHDISDLKLPAMFLSSDCIYSNILEDNTENLKSISLSYQTKKLSGQVSVSRFYSEEIIPPVDFHNTTRYSQAEEFTVNGLTVFVIDQGDFCSIAYQDNLTQYMMYLNTDFASAIEIAKTISDTES